MEKEQLAAIYLHDDILDHTRVRLNKILKLIVRAIQWLYHGTS